MLFYCLLLLLLLLLLLALLLFRGDYHLGEVCILFLSHVVLLTLLLIHGVPELGVTKFVTPFVGLDVIF